MLLYSRRSDAIFLIRIKLSNKLPLLLIVLMGLAGCTSTPEPHLSDYQQERLDETSKVYPMRVKDDCLKLDGHIITIRRETKGRDESAEYEAQFACFVKRYLEYRKHKKNKKEDGNRLLFYVNGGLNNISSIKDRAKEQIPLMMEDGYYPVFLAWDSALLSSYGEQIGFVRNGIRREHLQFTAPFSFLGDLLTPIPRAPVILFNQTGRFFDSTIESRGRPAYRLNKACHFEYARNIDNVRVGDDSISERDHLKTARYGVLTPLRLPLSVVAEDVGRRAWEGMIRRTENVVHHPGEFAPVLWPVKNQDNKTDTRHRDNRMKNYPQGFGQFARLLADIARCKAGTSDCDPIYPRASQETYFSLGNDIVDQFHRALNATGGEDGAGLQITLIGHSMGTMVLNELIPSFYDVLPIRDIVYMGAAASIRQTNIALENTLEKENVRFYSLMLHPPNEAREDSGKSMLPSGSLLEWIDEVLERPGTVLDRTMGKWRNLRVAKHVFSKEAQDNMKFVVFPRSGKVPLEHSQFNATALEFWKPEFWDGKQYRTPEVACTK